MSAAQLSLTIGTLVDLAVTGQLFCRCKVVDAKLAYGNLRYKLEPLAGLGSAWVNASSVTPAKHDELPPLVADTWGVK